MKKKAVLPWVLIAVFALSRWPGLMPLNFSAAYALAFCAGLYLPGATGWVVALAVLSLTDVLLNFFFYPQAGFSWLQFLATEAAYLVLVALGRAFGGKRPLWMLIGGGLFGAALFYFITNTASWLYLPYDKTFAGWIRALTFGLPPFPPTWEFFRNTLWSGGLFTGLFVGAMKLNDAAEREEEQAAPAESADGEPAPDPDRDEAKA